MARYNNYRSDLPMTDAEMLANAPAIFAAAPHESRSERYKYFSTVEVLEQMRKEGFQPFAVSQMGANKEGKAEFTKHMIRFSHPDAAQTSEGRHEIILINSHDGSSSYRLAAGFFRFVCCNGLMIGQKDFDVRVWHKGEVTRDVIEGSFKIISQTKENQIVMEDMMNTEMSLDKRIAFANEALKVRFGERGEVLTTDQILSSRRDADNGNSQWQVFNRVQENLMLGGQNGKSTKGKTRSVRAVTGMDKDIALNTGLWAAMKTIREAV